MIKIIGPAETSPTRQTKKTTNAPASFKPSAPASAGASSRAAPVSETAPASMMSALIALQSEGGGTTKTFAAAQRTLDLLDRLRLRLLEGEASDEDLEALSAAAAVRAHAGADPRLIAIYDEIALRARVELAKRGR